MGTFFSILLLFPWLAVGLLNKQKLRQFISVAFFSPIVSLVVFYFAYPNLWLSSGLFRRTYGF